MSFRNRYDNDVELTWALSALSDQTLYITNFNINSTSFVWTQKYTQKLTSPTITYNVVFEDYILLGKDTTKNRNCFMRFDPTNGNTNFYKCLSDNSYSVYDIYTSTLHTDASSGIYFGGRMNSENYFIYRTGVDLGDGSCIFTDSVLYTPSDYTGSATTLSFQNLSMSMTSFLSKSGVRTEINFSFSWTMDQQD